MAKGIKFSPAASATALADFTRRMAEKDIDWEAVPEGVANATKLCLGLAKGRLIYVPALKPKATVEDRKAAEDLLRKVCGGRALRVLGEKDRFLLVGSYVATEQEHLERRQRLSLRRPPKVH